MHKQLIPILLAMGVTACDQQATPLAAPRPLAPADLAKGEQVFNQVCKACHGTGAGGAPRLGNQAQWENRLAQGHDMLYQHALLGFIGPHGTMPPRGGKPDLSDAEVKAGVDYMLSRLAPG